MKENTNEMILVFDSIPANEGLARVTAASFCTGTVERLLGITFRDRQKP